MIIFVLCGHNLARPRAGSKEVIEAIINNKQESRNDWMIGFLQRREVKTAEIRIISSGGRIINLISITAKIRFPKDKLYSQQPG